MGMGSVVVRLERACSPMQIGCKLGVGASVNNYMELPGFWSHVPNIATPEIDLKMMLIVLSASAFGWAAGS